MITKEPNKGTSQGKIAIVVRSTDNFATRASTNSTIPIGGGPRENNRLNTPPTPKRNRTRTPLF